MTGAISTPRYSAEDFETASIRSAAPSYVSEVPSYHSQGHHGETIPAYSPPARATVRTHTRNSSTPTPSNPRSSNTTSSASTQQQQQQQQQRQIGLPPIPPAPQAGVPNLHNFRIPNWSANNALAARHYHSVAERRVSDGRYGGGGAAAVDGNARRYERPIAEGHASNNSSEEDILRPLEDPYLVGEEAAARTRRERLARENGEDVLIREDKHWDWLLSQMKNWDERERSWARFRRDYEMQSQRKNLLRRIGGRLV